MPENDYGDALQPRARRTERMLFRLPEAGDVHFLTELFSRHELVAHRPDPRPDSPEEIAARLARGIVHWKEHGFGRWAIEANCALVGWGGVTISKDFEGLNLSYHFQPECWGHGYATELVRETLAFASEDLRANRVIGLVRTGQSGLKARSGKMRL